MSMKGETTTMSDIDREETLLEEEKEKKREDLVPEYVLMEDGQEVEAFTMADAATYLGMQRANLNHLLKRLEKQGRPVAVYQKSYGGIGRYLLKRDLDEMRRVRPVQS